MSSTLPLPQPPSTDPLEGLLFILVSGPPSITEDVVSTADEDVVDVVSSL